MGENKHEIIENRIPVELRGNIIACLRGALEEDLNQFKESSHLASHNGLRHLKGDYINTRLQDELACDFIDVIPFSRYGYESRIIVDRSHKIAYNVISKSRMKQLMKEAKTKNVPHYTLLFAYALNKDLKASHKQLSLFGSYPFESEVMDKGYDRLVWGQIQKNLGYRYCVIAYEVKSGLLLDCEVLMLDRDLDIITKLDLSEYLTPEYADLTLHNENNVVSTEGQHRVKLKRTFTQETPSLVVLREDEKEKQV